ncbi:MAG TPA: FHA domain-containing protein, partial [Polyangiaceae bacterium]|nr:FHA domain-containing protein [Polyangiaceae bacterium]
MPRYALREGPLEHPLSKTPLFVGRGSDADIVLAGPLVSRRHAEFHETEAGVVVIDLDSQNGVLVNDVPIVRPTALLIGDRVTIGDNEFVLTELATGREGRGSEPELELGAASSSRRSEPDLNQIRESGRAPAGTYASEEASIATRRADALHLLSNVADKALALGRGQEAEHVLGTH